MLCNRRLLVRQLWSLGHLSIREGRLEESIHHRPYKNKRHVASGKGVWLHTGRILRVASGCRLRYTIMIQPLYSHSKLICQGLQFKRRIRGCSFRLSTYYRRLIGSTLDAPHGSRTWLQALVRVTCEVEIMQDRTSLSLSIPQEDWL